MNLSNTYVANRCAAVPVVQHSVPDSYLAVQGSVVHYKCMDGFVSSTLSPLTTVCDGISWTPAQLPDCEGDEHMCLQSI